MTLPEATVRALADPTWCRVIGVSPLRVVTSEDDDKAEFLDTEDTIRALAADWLAMRAVLEEVREHVAFAAQYDQDFQIDVCAEKSSAALARLDAVLTGGRHDG